MTAQPIQMIPAPALLDWLRDNAQAQREAGHILQAQHTMATREAIKRALKSQKIVSATVTFSCIETSDEKAAA